MNLQYTTHGMRFTSWRTGFDCLNVKGYVQEMRGIYDDWQDRYGAIVCQNKAIGDVS